MNAAAMVIYQGRGDCGKLEVDTLSKEGSGSVSRLSGTAAPV